MGVTGEVGSRPRTLGPAHRRAAAIGPPPAGLRVALDQEETMSALRWAKKSIKFERRAG
jgi:hypothetical protein